MFARLETTTRKCGITTQDNAVANHVVSSSSGRTDELPLTVWSTAENALARATCKEETAHGCCTSGPSERGNSHPAAQNMSALRLSRSVSGTEGYG